MAVNTIPVATDLILVMDNGIGASGQPLSINRTFKSVKTSASNDDLHAVATTIIDLQSKVNQGIQRRDIVELQVV